MCHSPSVIRQRRHHERLLARRLLRYLEILPAMEKVAAVKLRQVFRFFDNQDLWLIHVAKIENNYE